MGSPGCAALRCGTAYLPAVGKYTVWPAGKAVGGGVDAIEATVVSAISCLKSPRMTSVALLASCSACSVEVLALESWRVFRVREK